MTRDITERRDAYDENNPDKSPQEAKFRGFINA
jgi:hypothetical protein